MGAIGMKSLARGETGAGAGEGWARRMTVALIAEILEVDAGTIGDGDRLREDLGMDSLGSLELLSSLGHELSLDLEPEDAMGIVTVGDACAFVERHLERAGAEGAR